jgi:DNA adenine methylase
LKTSSPRLKPPIPWFGGKSGLTPWLLPHLPEHSVYVEVFGGSGALLFAKEPAPVEVYNDLDGGLCGFFRILQEPRAFARFRRVVENMPYSRAEYLRCREEWQQEQDAVRRAAMWFYVARASFSGLFGGSWSFTAGLSSRGMAATVSAYLSSIDRLPEVHARLRRVQIEQHDFRFILKTYDRPGALFYLDPPYIPETRRDGGYSHEMDAADHAELVSLLLNLKGYAILSGYDHPLYAPLQENGWERAEREVHCRAVGRTRTSGLQGVGSAAHQTRTECLWLSPGITNHD